ncbi:MAG: class I SAM-dependent rRNA methyltransferase [Halieaceae bacterium]|nr:class I SAM-dependent rRNA methyltransferase [Halieaceae bacterium]
MPTSNTVWLNPGADRRLRQGHAWIYSNEIDSKRSHLSAFEAGDVVNVAAASGEILATAWMEPHSLICARVLGHLPDLVPDRAWCLSRLDAALALRERYFDTPYYRLVYGDSDGLSGVIVDRFGGWLVLQLNTAGAERHGQVIIDALVERLAPAGILLRADSRSRREQGLADRLEVVHGQVPEVVPVQENGVSFLAPLHGGQKTGWFYDHRENRARLARLCRGLRVLDVYSYIGAWGLQAAAAGAAEVHCIDNSAPALDMLRQSAVESGLATTVHCHHGRADQLLREMADAGERFDAIVLDPPAFVQRKRDLGKGRKAYERINGLALSMLAPAGVLVSASCSMHLSDADLNEAVARAARRQGRALRQTWRGGQGADHPVHPQIAETRYLKALFYDAIA